MYICPLIVLLFFSLALTTLKQIKKHANGGRALDFGSGPMIVNSQMLTTGYNEVYAADYSKTLTEAVSFYSGDVWQFERIMRIRSRI